MSLCLKKRSDFLYAIAIERDVKENDAQSSERREMFWIQKFLIFDREFLKEIKDALHNILKKTKEAVVTLRGVFEGKHDKYIEETLDQYQVPTDKWWSALYRMVEGLSTMSKLSRNKLQQSDCGFDDSQINWDRVEM